MYAIPTLHVLSGNKMLEAVVAVGPVTKFITQLEQNAAHLNVPFKVFKKGELTTTFKTLLEETQPDMVLVFGFSYKIPAELFDIPKLGFYNVHFSLLPAYRGKNPVFWQLKNGDSVSGISVHKVTEDFDTGPLLMQKDTLINPGDSYGILSARLSLEAGPLVLRGIEKLQIPNEYMLLDQNDSKATYCPPTGFHDLKIDWENQSAREIDSLVNAANPDYGGAVTLFRGQPMCLLEVSLAQLNSNGEVFIPGTVVISDPNHGIFVACKDGEFLRLNILQSSEGIMSGFKLAGFGIRNGELFQTPTQPIL
jgi:methionyl-tRNA formyltransferase